MTWKHFPHYWTSGNMHYVQKKNKKKTPSGVWIFFQQYKYDAHMLSKANTYEYVYMYRD